MLRKLYDVLTLLSWGCVVTSAISGGIWGFATYELVNVPILPPLVICVISGWIYVATWWWREYLVYLDRERRKKRHSRNRKR